MGGALFREECATLSSAANSVSVCPAKNSVTLRAQILKKFKILKFSSELEIFKRATQQTPIFCGEFWRSGLKISSDLDFFSRFGPLGEFALAHKYFEEKIHRGFLESAQSKQKSKGP